MKSLAVAELFEQNIWLRPHTGTHIESFNPDENSGSLPLFIAMVLDELRAEDKADVCFAQKALVVKAGIPPGCFSQPVSTRVDFPIVIQDRGRLRRVVEGRLAVAAILPGTGEKRKAANNTAALLHS
jgi:hypothetical protein